MRPDPSLRPSAPPARRPSLLLASLALALLLAVAAVPPGAAKADIRNPNDPTPTTLYFHLAGLQDYPINTQEPDDRYGGAIRKGVATNSATCLPEGVPGIARGEHHTTYGYSSPGYVEYDREVNGGPGIHPERGISFDVRLDTTAPFVMHWFLETQASGVPAQGGADPSTLPVAVPNVMVKATMRAGDAISVGDRDYNTGDILARGTAGPAQLHPLTTDVVHHEVAGRHVYEFILPMEFESDTILAAGSFNMRIDTYIDNPLCTDPEFPQDQYLMPNVVAVHSSPGLRPRLEFSVLNPLEIHRLHPQFIGEELVVHVLVNSPWGNYDVDESEAGVRLEVAGPTPARSLQRLVMNPEAVTGHDHHTDDLWVTWVWPYEADGAQPGTYAVRLVAVNDQATAEAVGESQFQIGGCTPSEPEATGHSAHEGGGEGAGDACKPDAPTRKAPGPAAAFLLGGVALAAFLRRR